MPIRQRDANRAPKSGTGPAEDRGGQVARGRRQADGWWKAVDDIASLGVTPADPLPAAANAAGSAAAIRTAPNRQARLPGAGF
jgi:hypothetical protein